MNQFSGELTHPFQFQNKHEHKSQMLMLQNQQIFKHHGYANEVCSLHESVPIMDLSIRNLRKNMYKRCVVEIRMLRWMHGVT